jgi:hypothetical protein
LADRLCAAYHVHLYTLACTNRGPVPCKWDGGAGLMRGDERTWGLAEWVQEIRFTFLPLYAANRLDMARGLTRHYTQMQPYLFEQTRKMWGIEGLWIPETVLPWGHAEDWVLRDDPANPTLERFGHWDPSTAPYGLFERYNRYVGLLFTSGLEISEHYLTYYRYSGDEEFLRDEAYPTVREVCRFTAGLMREGDDGRWHLDPANALETWWLVRDPADTLAGIEAVFPALIRLSERFDRDAALRARCQDILDRLPDPPRGHWRPDGTVEPDENSYAPAAAVGDPPRARNGEIPALYRVFPFAVAGSSELAIARHTFRRRIFGITNSWSLDAIWAARLRLPDDACHLLAEHAQRFNRYRYGGWDSANSGVFPDGLAVAPYMDGGGLSALGVGEILLQSHGGTIRLLPAVVDGFSGIFRLRAEGGFLVGAHFAHQRPTLVHIESTRGGPCRVINPWDGPCRLTVLADARGRTAITIDGPMVEFDTAPGGVYLLTPSSRPLSDYAPEPIHDRANDRPGLPGRDTT